MAILRKETEAERLNEIRMIAKMRSSIVRNNVRTKHVTKSNGILIK